MHSGIEFVFLAAVFVPIVFLGCVYAFTWNAYADWYNRHVAQKIWDEKMPRLRYTYSDETRILDLCFAQIRPSMPGGLKVGIVIVRICLGGMVLAAVVLAALSMVAHRHGHL